MSSGLSGLDRCACKRGFYTLRDCGNQATTTCSICSRRVCDEHLAPRVDAKVCVECAARQEEEGSAAPAPAVEQGPPLQRLTGTAFSYRTRYYRSRGYEPIWWATYDPYWDDWGTRYYDDDDDDGGGFSDS